jgi:exopolysaccharide biosynthesis polyprenyl glycosylphosphotransferase
MRIARALIATDVAVIGATSVAAGATSSATLLRTVLTVVVLAAAGLYRSRLQYSALDDLPRVLLGVGLVAPVGAALSMPSLLTPSAFATFPLAWPATLAAAVLLGRTLHYPAQRIWRRYRPGAPTVVIGSGDIAIRLVEALTEDRSYGLAPLGLVGPPPNDHAYPVPLLGDVGDLDEVVAKHQPTHLILTLPTAPDASLVTTLRQCRHEGITVFVVPGMFELASGRAGAELVHGVPLIRMRPEPTDLRRWALKRVLDVVGAGIGLLLLAPILVACALAVRLESGRAGVFFRQERIGHAGKPFTIMKFRSLTPATNQESAARWSIHHDDRVGPVGRVLRATSLDELPQLLNVLRGTMSLVGPRPERPFFVEQFQQMYEDYVDRHRVPAGITGWAQIHGLRGDTSIADRVRFDNYYIENWSIGLDLKIIIRTVGSMLNIRRR